MSSNTILKKTVKIILNVLLYLFLAVCVFSVVVTLISKRDSDGAAEIFGMQMRVVTSNSMGESDQTDVSQYDIGSIPVGSVVFVKTMPDDPAKEDEWYSELKVGDVLTFKYLYTSHVTITHRITDITEKDGGGYVIELQGDNKNADTELLTQKIDTTEEGGLNYIIGKVVGKSLIVGKLITLMQKPLGIFLVVILPCFIIIMLEVIKIINVIGADKKQKTKEEQQKKEAEIEELKRKLAALEQSKEDAPSSEEITNQSEE